MADPIRLSILNAIKTALEGIDGSGFWRTTMTTVEIAAKALDDDEIRTGTMPYAVIIPQEEDVRAMAFAKHRVTWPIDVLVYFEPSARTAAAMANDCMETTTDVRRALTADPTLGVEGVVELRLRKRAGSEAVEEAIQVARGWVSVRAEVFFIESMGAT